MPGPTGPEDLGQIDGEFDLPEEISRLHEPATPETFDRRKPQDRTGLMMQAFARQNKHANYRVLGDADMLACSRCSHQTFRVLCSNVDNQIQIICGNRGCGAMFPALEVTPPQMNDRMARNHGLYIPPTRN